MAEISLNIHGKSYGVACDDGQEERVAEVGKYVDNRARAIAAAGAASNENHLMVLTALVLADEIKELSDEVRELKHYIGAIGDGGVVGMSGVESGQIASAIEQLAGRIDSVTAKLRGRQAA